MDHLQLAYPEILWWFVPVLLGGAALKVFFSRTRGGYQYPLAHLLVREKKQVFVPVRTTLFIIRLILLTGFMFLIARPQWVDTSSSVSIKGVDIVLTIDVSGSMELFDDLRDQTPRIAYAKKEAERFVDKRTNDPIGVVLFGKEALSKVPLTLDKLLLKSIINDIEIGQINQDGTALLTGLAIAINRLRSSQAKSKVIVLLTDGISNADTLKPDDLIKIAQKFKIKVYTLGVGGENGGYIYNNWGQIQRSHDRLDVPLLKKIASKTGGRFFRVYKQEDMKRAYEIIDTLEKTDYTSRLFHNYYEAFGYFIWIILLVLMLELFLKNIWWRGI